MAELENQKKLENNIKSEISFQNINNSFTNDS